MVSILNVAFMQANLGLLKVLVAKSQTEGLQMHLRSMVEGLLNWQDSTKNQFKAKVCEISLSASLNQLRLFEGFAYLSRIMLFSLCYIIQQCWC